MSDHQGRSRNPVARSVALVVIGFVATLALLFGLGSVVGSPPPSTEAMVPSARPLATGSPVASASASAGSVAPSSTAAGPSASGSVVPPTAPDAVLVGAGDIADCGLDADSQTADLIAGIAGTVFTAGDNVYPTGSLDQYRDCYAPTWGRFLDRTRPAPGNHEYLTRGAEGYLAYFGQAAAPDGTTWYSYDLGTWHVVVLDGTCDPAGGCGPDSPQGRWLAADLAASTTTCTMAIWHQPRWSSGEHGDDPSVGPFWQALYQAGADVVVNGHDHDYERFRPQDPDGRLDPDRGLTEFVVGTGGAATREFSSIAANSVVRATGIHGVIRFDLEPTGYDWHFISTTGELADSGHGTCH